MNIKTNIVDGMVVVESPYNTDFVKKIKNLGGKWNAENKTWSVSADLESFVLDILVDVYGYGQETANILVSYNDIYISGWIIFNGRTILDRPSRDSDVRLGEGVSIISGEFPASAGSRNNPMLIDNNKKWTGQILVRNMPLSHIEKLKENIGELYFPSEVKISI